MKTAISVPANVFEEAERLAKRLKMSRSALYSQALRDYLRLHAPDAITDAHNQVVDTLEEKPDAFLEGAARKVFEKAEW